MTATGHALIGTVIAAKIGNPALAVPIALASHFAADAFPHWDTGLHRKENGKKKFLIQSAVDVAAGFILSYLLINLFFPGTNLSYAFFIIIIAQLPDWLTAPYLFFDMNFPPFSWVYKVQKVFDNELVAPWGVINQVAAVILIIALAKFF
jgi:hypothetical protein